MGDPRSVTDTSSHVVASDEQQLRRLDSLRGLELWRDAVVQRIARRTRTDQRAQNLPAARAAGAPSRLFESWEELLAAGLERMRAEGVLRPETEAVRLARGIMAALLGGCLLAQTTRDVAPLEIALDMAIDHVRTFAA